jgi:two-component system sensor histidine kinase DesK
MTDTPTSASHLHAEQPKRLFAYTWLAYTGFLFIEPLMVPSRNLWFATLAVFAVFLLIFSAYVRVNDETGRRPLWVIGATFMLGLATFPWNQGGSTFFVYTAAFIPFSVRSTSRVLLLFLGECVAIIAEHFLCPAHGTFAIDWVNAMIAIFLVLVIGGGNIFFAQQKRADYKLRMAQEEIEAIAAVAERERIARDLHDVLGHTLSVITLKAELAGRLLESDPARAALEIADVERTARTALAEVREAIGGYRARGLSAEIESARRALDVAGVTLVAELSPEGAPQLSAAEETVLALALREAVTNIVRHARARTCRLRFVLEGGRRRLLVEDDGQHAVMREGNGLRGMRERIESIGGTLSLDRDTGTRLLIELPAATTTL